MWHMKRSSTAEKELQPFLPSSFLLLLLSTDVPQASNVLNLGLGTLMLRYYSFVDHQSACWIVKFSSAMLDLAGKCAQGQNIVELSHVFYCLVP
jgi:hypothetical protein